MGNINFKLKNNTICRSGIISLPLYTEEVGKKMNNAS